MSSAIRPEFLRFPRPGETCPYTGLRRSFLFSLAKEGKIKTVSLRERNKRRGCRLINFDSLMAYLAKAGEEPKGREA